MRYTLAVVAVFILLPVGVWAGTSPIHCGAAVGYPPYQFRDHIGQPKGLDIEVMRALSAHLQTSSEFTLDRWDTIVGLLRMGSVDCVVGMEINEKRQRIFNFTRPYYRRKAVVFALEENPAIDSLNDLEYLPIGGDRHSYVEDKLLEMGLKNRIRIRRLKSKDESMRMLKAGEVVAVIAPLEVGLYLAKRYDIRVKIIDDSDPGTPVAIAVSKDNPQLLQTIDKALGELFRNGTIDDILIKWQQH